MTFDQVIEILEEELGVDLSTDSAEDQEPLLVYFDDIAVELSELADEAMLCLEAELFGLPDAQSDREDLMEQLLAACAASAVTYSGSVYLDLPSNQVLLRRTYPLKQLAQTRVTEMLSNFVSNVDYYNNAI